MAETKHSFSSKCPSFWVSDHSAVIRAEHQKFEQLTETLSDGLEDLDQQL